MLKKQSSILLVLFLVNLYGQAQTTAANRADWFEEAKFGMFVHWGLYSILEGSYNGHTLPDTTFKNGRSWYAEWIQQRLEVPEKTYQALAGQFNPAKFNADEWILEARNAGMKYFVITSKHHDGFALWDSKVSTYDIGSTPFKRDILGELVRSCKKYGLKYGFYYSHWQDWEHPGGEWPGWSKIERTDAEFEKYWQQKSLPQVAELIKRYDPDLLWFDTWDEPTKITDKRRDELIALIRKMSPKCLINGRISFASPGNDIDFLEMHDNQYPAVVLQRPWQTPATMQESWGWHAKDYRWKPAAQMIGYLVGNTAKGGNYLLNVGPKPDGTIPPMAIKRLREMGGWLAANGEAVYGAGPLPALTGGAALPKQMELAYTYKKDKDGSAYIYISLLKPQPQQIIFPFPYKKILDCRLLETNMPVQYEDAEGKLKIVLPERIAAITDGVQVIKIKLKDP